MKFVRIGCISLIVLFALTAVVAKLYTRGQSEGIYDAVVRYHAENNPDHYRVYFLLINRQDPSQSLLDRLKDCGYSIRKRSDAPADPHAHTGMETIDKTTGEKGAMLSLQNIFWYSPSHVLVFAGDGGYVAEKRGRKWYVVNRMIYGG